MINFHPTTKYGSHTVIVGETLGSIIRQFYSFQRGEIKTAIETLARINNIAVKGMLDLMLFRLKPGRKMILPSLEDVRAEMKVQADWYLVRPGDTLERIVEKAYTHEPQEELEHFCGIIALGNKGVIGLRKVGAHGIYTLKPGTWIRLLSKAEVEFCSGWENLLKGIDPDTIPSNYDSNQQQPEMILSRILLGLNSFSPVRPLFTDITNKNKPKN